MTKPKLLCSPRTGGRLHRCYLLGLLGFVLLISAPGCALFKIPTVEVPVVPLVLLTEHKVPEFSDDMNYDALWASLEQSLAYLRVLAPETRFAFGADTYSVAHVAASLERFGAFLETAPDGQTLNRFLRKHYHVYQSIGGQKAGRVLFTGYYEPFLRGSYRKSGRFRYPLYTRPDDLVSVDLSLFSDSFKDETIWGRLNGTSLVPYHNRREIDSAGALDGKADVLAWVDDPIDLFFLHIQGSGKLYMDTGEPINVHYNSPNGRPYRSIGKVLIDNGAIPREEMSMQAIKKYLRTHPAEADDILNANPSYVFFNTEQDGPIGSLGRKLTPGRSIATDRRLFPKGALAFIETQKPLVDGSGTIESWSGFGRFVLNQDTGGAIRGPGRADLFWGNGPYAELAAGYMQHPGKLYFLVLKPEK